MTPASRGIQPVVPRDASGCLRAATAGAWSQANSARAGTFGWHDRRMSGGAEFKVSKELADALESVRAVGFEVSDPAAVLVLARYIDALAKNFGFSEHGDVLDEPLVRAMRGVPVPAAEFIGRCVPESQATNPDGMRDRLYAALVGLAGERRVPELVNDVFALGQIYWNLRRTAARPRLPIQDSQILKVGKKTKEAQIKVPAAEKDFAFMRWSERVKEPGVYSSSSGGLRKQGARLCVLVAIHVLRSIDGPADGLSGTGAHLQYDPDGKGPLIVWDTEIRTSVPQPLRADSGEAPIDHRSVVEHSFARMKFASGFGGRDPELEFLTDFCTGPEERLLVFGDRFSGKSALMSEFFVNTDLPDILRLGYFVPPNHRQDARYEAMVRDLVRQAYLLTEGKELSAEVSDNPGAPARVARRLGLLERLNSNAPLSWSLTASTRTCQTATGHAR